MSELNRFKVLIVDDDPSIRMLVSNMLRSNGFGSIVAADGLEGLNKARLELPDLILMDVNMPSMNGIEACRSLKQDPKTASIPVIFMTMLSSDSDRMNGFDAGGDDYVIKPVSYKELLARMKYFIRQSPRYEIAFSSLKHLVQACVNLASTLETATVIDDTKHTADQMLSKLSEIQKILENNDE